MAAKNSHYVWVNKPKDLKPIRCLYCDSAIKPEDIKHANQKFCCKQHQRWFAEDEKIRKKKLKSKPGKICIMCGKKFVPKVGNQICCSPHCSADRYRERNRKYNRKKRGLTLRTCLVCKKEFYGKKNRVTCSEECFKIREKTRQHGVREKNILGFSVFTKEEEQIHSFLCHSDIKELGIDFKGGENEVI